MQAFVQNGRTNLTFTLPAADLPARAATCWSSSAATSARADQIKSETNLSKVSIVGVGMRSHAGVALKLFEILAHENIHVHLISTSEIKISCVIERSTRSSPCARFTTASSSARPEKRRPRFAFRGYRRC